MQLTVTVFGLLESRARTPVSAISTQLTMPSRCFVVKELTLFDAQHSGRTGIRACRCLVVKEPTLFAAGSLACGDLVNGTEGTGWRGRG